MRNFMAEQSRYNIPVVVFSDSVGNRAFSLMHAVLKLMEANRSTEQKVRGALLIILPPAIPISDILHETYRQYIIMARAMESSA